MLSSKTPAIGYWKKILTTMNFLCIFEDLCRVLVEITSIRTFNDPIRDLVDDLSDAYKDREKEGKQ